MRARKWLPIALLLILVIAVIGGALLIHRGFRATNRPSAIETAIARKISQLFDSWRRPKRKESSTTYSAKFAGWPRCISRQVPDLPRP